MKHNLAKIGSDLGGALYERSYTSPDTSFQLPTQL